jgi:phage terminase large subunit-like protein
MTLTAETLRKLPRSKREAILDDLTPDELEAIQYDWPFWARPSQLPPIEWGVNGCYIWNLRMGRGTGKTRTAAETFRTLIQEGKHKYTSLCGATAEEVRDIMINGESGIMACCPPWFTPKYVPSQKKLFWPNGAITSIFYGSEPEKSRGAQSDLLWCDEIHKWQYPEDTFDNLIFGLRLGEHPLCIVTSTPKPTSFTRELEERTDDHGNKCVITTVGSTYENKANLSPIFFSAIIKKYEGTRLGEQELNAQIMDDNPAALFKREWISRDRVIKMPDPRMITRIGVGVDPAASHKKNSNHTGIITVYEGRAPKPDMLQFIGEVRNPEMKHFYIKVDNSIVGTPWEWGSKVRHAIEADAAGVTVIEDNQGGDMCESTLVNAGVKNHIERVHAVGDKTMRASPVSLIMQQGRIHFYRDITAYNGKDGDNLDVLEDELCQWIPGEDSPDRMDAMVHVINFFEPNANDDVAEKKARDFLRYIR